MKENTGEFNSMIGRLHRSRRLKKTSGAALGLPSVAAVLERRGKAVNVKRVSRLYSEEALAVGRSSASGCCLNVQRSRGWCLPIRSWAIVFLVDGLGTLSVVDAFTRECLALKADTSLGSRRVTRVLERLIEERGVPEKLRSDNVLTRDAVAERKKRFLSIPYGMKMTVSPSGFHMNQMARAYQSWQKRIQLAQQSGLCIGLLDWDTKTNTVSWSDENYRHWAIRAKTSAGW